MAATTETVATFRDALDGLDVGLTRTDAAGFADALAGIVEPPAVGVPLPFAGVSLDGLDVETQPTPADLRAARTGITPARFGVAQWGSLFLAATRDGVEPVSLYPETHVAVLAASDLVGDPTAAFERLAAAFESGQTTGILATGASATADMGELVAGVHGPGAVHVVLLEDR